jgi:ribosome-associated protein
MAGLRVTPQIVIDEDELHEQFILASGPGGQNVNKVATAVQLRFDVARSPSLPEDVRERLISLAGRRMTRTGVLVLTARSHRTQERNREDARQRLFTLIRQAAIASKRRRLESKTVRAGIKRNRAKPIES